MANFKSSVNIHEILRSHLVPNNSYIYGFADLSGLISKKFEGFDWGISIGKKLDDRIVNSILHGPTMEYYLHYRKINDDLSKLTRAVSVELNKMQISAISVEPTVSTNDLNTIYSRTLRTDVSHKMVATRAGLGWIGKTDLLVSRKFGPRLRLASILINTPVKPFSIPVNKSRCGSCDVCIRICPAKAANGKLWNINVDRDEFFNAQQCREKCAWFGRERLTGNARVCGICVSACPLGQGNRE